MIYQKVVSYCVEKNISISAFEKMCNIGNGTVGGWKENSSKPSMPTLEKMQSATGVPISEWVSSEKEDTTEPVQ